MTFIAFGGEEGGAFGLEEDFSLSYGGIGLDFDVATSSIDGLFFFFILLDGLFEGSAISLWLSLKFDLRLRWLFLFSKHLQACPHANC